MAKALSVDLRQRVIAAIDGGLSCRQAAGRFGVRAASDTRNTKAVELLSDLYSQTPSPLAVKSLNDAIVEYEAACADVAFDSDPPPFEPRVSASLSSIGFGWHPKNIDEVLTVLATDARLAMGEVTAARAS